WLKLETGVGLILKKLAKLNMWMHLLVEPAVPRRRRPDRGPVVATFRRRVRALGRGNLRCG
ncbi:hypothetical protein SB773_30790, partial [Bacillus sp. SIMBA_074]|uniref:hypothetical protein n=1 Tax=Bacillus sp. SIMBA_074 TaxID=3085812 RepID=UPI00397BD9AE